MFTGLVEFLGTVTDVTSVAGGVRLRIDAEELDVILPEGASIAVDGVCLTALDADEKGFAAEVSPETLACTNMGDYRPGTRVNLERPLRAGAPLGGHFVQGHVDAVCHFAGVVEEGEFVRFSVDVPDEQRPFLVEKGSVAVNGVSLTVAGLTDSGFEVQLIPHTLAMTNLTASDRADRLNLEVDILGKYVAQFVAPHLDGPSRSNSTTDL